MTRDRDGQHNSADRVAPHDLAAETALLGAAMLSTAALEVLGTQTKPEDFYSPAHRHIARALARAFAEGWPADPVTVADELRRRGSLDLVGGTAALLEIQSSAPASINAERYAHIVRDHATLRRLIGSAGEVADSAYGGAEDASEAVARARALFDQVAATDGSRNASTLDVADVGALLDADLEPEEAHFLTRSDGQALLYPGKMHVFQGEPSSGKSMIAVHASVEILARDGAVLYLDYEDTAKGILRRLLALGVDPAVARERFRYIQPSGAFGSTEKAELERILATLNPDLVVIDGVAEALARDGLSEDKASEVVGWIERLPRWLSRSGAAVLMLDHVVKDREQQGRWARGSSAKLATVDGATYQVKVSVPFSRHRDGVLRLVIAKDRPGGVGAIGDVAAVVVVEPHADGARVVMRIERDTGEIANTDHWKPTILMRRVSDELEATDGPLAAAMLKSLVHADKPKLITEAISRLIVEGYVVEQRVGRTTKLVLVKPYEGEHSTPPTRAAAPPLFDDPAIDPATGEPYDPAEFAYEAPGDDFVGEDF